MHLESDSEMPYYKPEVIQAAQDKALDNSVLRAYHVQKEDTAKLKERD